jgi:16S rRNA (guanine1207-N2)-methyltransferase
MPQDVYFKKTIRYNFWKQCLDFRTSQELFSSHDIDLGTQFLVRTLVEGEYKAPQRILDMGCGYGPLGMSLKKLHPASVVHMVDRDALAVDYSAQNVTLNALSGVEVYGSLGYDDVKEKAFDLIVSNIPGKASETVIAYLLREAGHYLTPGGLVGVVVVDALDQMTADILKNTPGLEVVLKRTRPGHSVFHYRFKELADAGARPLSALERGFYRRNSQVFRAGQLEYAMQTAYGLPEFDSLDYRTEMLLKAISERPDLKPAAAAAFNPGQGHFAVGLWAMMHPQRIDLIDRDLLALRYTQVNLELNQCPAGVVRLCHQTGMAGTAWDRYGLIAGVLREDEGTEAVEFTVRQAAERLSPEGVMMLAGGSTAVTRLAAAIQKHHLLRIPARDRYRGNGLLVLIPPGSTNTGK